MRRGVWSGGEDEGMGGWVFGCSFTATTFAHADPDPKAARCDNGRGQILYHQDQKEPLNSNKWSLFGRNCEQIVSLKLFLFPHLTALQER